MAVRVPPGLASFTIALAIAALFLLPASALAQPIPTPTGGDPTATALPNEFVNLTDTAANWTSDFSSVTWPAGPFSAIQVVLTLTNFGDPWDRAEWVDLNNVTLLDVTTLENGSDNNRAQSEAVNITEYEDLFTGPGYVWWAAMPNWISPCDTKAPGCWTGVLSFQFTAGPLPVGLPTIEPVLPFATLTTTAPWVNGTLRVAGSYSRAEAVLFQEGQGTDEFWYAQAFDGRELRWQWDNQTVLAMFPLPFINSGGALGGTNSLYEWNGTPAPGTLARPAVEADLTPWISLLNGSTWYNFTVVDNENSWQIGLSLFLWNASDLRQVEGAGSAVHPAVGARTSSITGFAYANLSEPYATESYNLTWSDYLNTTSSSFDVVSESETEDHIVSGSVTLDRVAVSRCVFDVRIDGTGSVHVAVFGNWTNTTTVLGNGQNATAEEHGSLVWTIDGSGGGLLSTEFRASTGSAEGNYSAPSTLFASQWGWFQNRSAKDGVGTSDPPTSVRSGTPPVPLSGRFLVTPAPGSIVTGPVSLHLMPSAQGFAGGTVSWGSATWSLPRNDTVIVNVPSLQNGTYRLNVTSPTDEGWSTLSVPLTVSGWSPTYAAPLMANITVSSPLGEAPWSATFQGAADGGTAPYFWAWTFGDGGSGATQNISHPYSFAGTFVVSLNVTDSAGRVAPAEADIVVFPQLTVSLSSPLLPWAVAKTATVTGSVVGGQEPYAYAWGPLPAGCTNGETSLSCTPPSPGNLSVELTVTDSLGYSAVAWFNTSVPPSAAATPTSISGPLALGSIAVVASVIAAAIVVLRYRSGRRPGG